MDIIEKITQVIEPSLSAMGYQLVLVRLMDGGKRKTLSVMAERKDDKAMGFDDCTEISQMVSALLDVEDPIKSAYNLEVCSPGLDRPLTREEDYTRFAGQEAKLETMVPIDGRKRFRGIIEGIESGQVQLSMPEGKIKIPFGNIRIAKLTVGDAVIKKENKRK